VTVSAIDPPAFYGKLPGHGDFVGRGLTGEQEAALDRWLAGWLAAAREEWGAEFDERYRDAQPWLYGGERLSAVAIPSADRVGRLFPLLAAAHAGVDLQTLYDTVVAAIGEAWSGDHLIEALGGLVPEGGDDAPPPGWFVPDENEPAMPDPLGGTGAETIGAMLA
jgi:type VI secretion system protein ImpM